MMANPSGDGNSQFGKDVGNHLDKTREIYDCPAVHKISLGYGNPHSKEILRMVNNISIVRIFASVTEPMTVRDICKKAKVSKTTLYRKISELEELRLLVRKGRSAKDTENLGTGRMRNPLTR